MKDLDIISKGLVVNSNSSTTVLTTGSTFTGEWFDCSAYPSVVTAVKTDQDGSLYVDFSPDASNVDSTLTFGVAAAVNEVHRITVTRRYFRVRFRNNSASNQTEFRLQVLLGSQTQLNSSLSSTIQQDSDALVTRCISEELSIIEGKFSGYDTVNKFGTNSDIDTGTVPEDVWEGSGTYKGFPTGSPETVSIVSTSVSDTGQLTFTGLKTSTSTAYESETVTLTGTTPVTSVNSWYRIHTARYSSGAATTFNVGTITCNHSTTTGNVFFSMQPQRSQTNMSGYTIPTGCTGYVRRITGNIRSNASTFVEGSLWIRTTGGSPRLRRPFIIATADRLVDNIYGGLVISGGSDIILRITSVSSNNTSISAGYDLIVVKN